VLCAGNDQREQTFEVLNVQGLEAVVVGQIAANHEKTLVVDFQDPDIRIRW
jgi:hypothetical protein